MPRKPIAAAFLVVSTCGLAAAEPRAAVTPARAAAQPFDLADVRLLDGPFREAMARGQEYLLSLDPDRLLHTFRVNAGLPSAARPYGGWEAPEVELRGHTLGHYLTACALMFASTGDARFKERAETMVAELAKVQAALAAGGSNRGYLSAFPETHFDRLESGRRVWAPYYVIHKIMAGLLEVHRRFGSAQALEVARGMADWVRFRLGRLGDEQLQRALEVEFGGMQEALTTLYEATGEVRYLETARRFDHRAVFDPLARGDDPLDGLHANTQIPKAVGSARDCALTGEGRYCEIARAFWRHVARRRSYVIGGNSEDEHFFPTRRFSRHLGESTAETCNTYNMLRLTRELFFLEPSGELMDFYELGLLNHILASQDPATGMVSYYVPLKPGSYRTYSTPEASFWCCVDTGLESHAKYGDTVYARDAESLYVNLFLASELRWRDKGLTLRQQTSFPREGATRLALSLERPVRLALRIRHPGWAAGLSIAVNGRPEPVTGPPGGYVSLEREWRDGDAVEIRLPMSLRLSAMPDDPTVVAFLYGPVVLAADLGGEGLTREKRYGPYTPEYRDEDQAAVPALVASDPGRALSQVRAVPGAPLRFATQGLGRPREVTLLPFAEAFDRRYSVYFTLDTPRGFDERQARRAAESARRRDVERRTLDAVRVGEAESEQAHGFRGEGTDSGSFHGRRFRQARNGWFGYRLAAPAEAAASLLVTYWGGETRPRRFEVLVDGEKIADQRLFDDVPGEFFDAVYPLPESLTRGKQTIEVRFRSGEGQFAGGIFDLRLLRSAP